MSALLLSARLALRQAAAPRGAAVTPRASLYSRPAKDQLGFRDNALGLIGLFVGILGPSAWILAHLEDYKKKV